MTLTWGKARHSITCPMDPAISVAGSPLAPGHNAFAEFEKRSGLTNDLDPVCMPAHLIPPDNDAAAPTNPPEAVAGPTNHAQGEPIETNFDLSPDDITTAIMVKPNKEDLLQPSLAAQFLRRNRLSFTKLRHMARRGIFPGKLVDCEVPMCSVCLCGKATKHAWRTKGKRAPPNQLSRERRCQWIKRCLQQQD